MRRTPKCKCGCGQTPSTTCRMRKAECRGCEYIARVSTAGLKKLGPPICPGCTERMHLPCLEDRMIAGDDDAYSELVARGMPQTRPGTKHPRARCEACNVFKASTVAQCKACGYVPGQGYVPMSSKGTVMAF